MIFLDLTKAYDALDRSRCLDILEGLALAQAPGRYYKTTGATSPWWQGQAATTGRPLRGLQGFGGDFKSPFHFLHHLPRRPPIT